METVTINDLFGEIRLLRREVHQLRDSLVSVERISAKENREIDNVLRGMKKGKEKNWRVAFNQWAPLFDTRLSNKAEKQIRLLPPEIRNRVFELFRALENDPVPASVFDVTKLSGRVDSYRIRLSSFRVVYVVFWKERFIRIVKVERRSDSTYWFI
jgi:mRNA interferase RelE/StbE